jgi:hypothetical protein
VTALQRMNPWGPSEITSGESARRRFPKWCCVPKSGAARIGLGSGS